VTSALTAPPAAHGVGAHSLDALEVLVVGAGPHPGAEAATIAREIAARLPEGPPGRVVLIAHSPDGDHDEPFPVPAHRVGRLLQGWADRGLSWQQTRDELATVRDELAAVDGVAALRRAGVLVIPGRAAFIGRNRLELDLPPQLGGPRLVSPSSTVIATGTAPAIPEVPGILGAVFHTCSTVGVVAMMRAPIGVGQRMPPPRLVTTLTAVSRAIGPCAAPRASRPVTPP